MEGLQASVSGGFHFPFFRLWSSKCQYTVSSASSGPTAGPNLDHALRAFQAKKGIDNAGPHVGSPHFVNHGFDSKPASFNALITAPQSFQVPAFFRVNQDLLTEESNSNPALAITGAIHGAI